MKKIIFRVGVIAVIAIVFTNCVSFTLDSSDLPKTATELKEGKEYNSLGETKGQSSSFHLLWFIPVTERANFDLAIKDAIESKGGDNIINLQYKINRQIWLLGRVTTYKINGEVVQYKD